MRKLLLLSMSVLLVGCMTIGKKFDINDADQLRPGISTSADAIQLLGPPTASSTVPAGTLLQWQYSQGTLIGGRGAHLAVLFDTTGRMTRVTHRVDIKN